MKYQPRPGVALVSICRMPVLIPTREAYAHCREIMRLPLMWAMLWESLSKGKPLDSVVKVDCIISKKPEEEIRKNLESVCQTLCEKGFMLAIPEEPGEQAPSGETGPSAAPPEQVN